MKELIGTAFLIASLYGAGSMAAREISLAIRREALHKVAQGMPSLVGLTNALRGASKKR